MLKYVNNSLFIEEVPCLKLVEQYGTPLYVYSQNTIRQAFINYQTIFPNALICYAVKANSNLSILKYLSNLGSGFDIVSGGELQRVVAINDNTTKVIFSGINKSEAEIQLALKHKILCFNIESYPEIDRIQKIAEALNTKAPISFRINPNVDAKTHPYISTGLKNNKFGIAYEDALSAYLYAQKQSHLSIIGIDCHIGSQLIDLSPLKVAVEKIFILIHELQKYHIHLKHVDLGGGIGIQYHDEPKPDYQDFAHYIAPFFAEHPNLKLILEPGRSIVGNSGILLTKVDFIKNSIHKNFIIVDAAMNDLARPSLYQAYHEIIPLKINTQYPEIIADIVGPVCESSDYLGKDRKIATHPGEYLAIKNSGAYTSSMASHYNTRLIAPEILVNGSKAKMIRSRDSFPQLIQNELPFLT